MTDTFAGKVAIVTGGASGIGKGLCDALARAGAHVVVADIDLPGAERVAAALAAAGGQARAAFLDVSSLEQVRRVVSETAAELGRLDYLFNNAAASATRGELRDLPIDPWHRAVDVNLLGVAYGCTAALPVMARQGAGHIVNIGSVAGLVGFPTSIPYGATKAAVVNLSVSLRMEAADLGVSVSVVCPGPVHDEQRPDLKLMGVERAAERILRGVARNRAVIVFPFSARVLWWLYRLSPAVLFPIGRKLVRDYRRKHPARAAEPVAG